MLTGSELLGSHQSYQPTLECGQHYLWISLGDIGVEETHIPGPAGLSIGENQLVDIGTNTVHRRAHSIQRLRSNHAHITCQKPPVNENRAQGPPPRCQGSSSCMYNGLQLSQAMGSARTKGGNRGSSTTVLAND